jgi:hypothetical protein
VDKFKGIHIHFGTSEFPNWLAVLNYFRTIDELIMAEKMNSIL